MTIVPSPAVMGRSLKHVYRMAEYLAPSLVVLEDVDLVVSSRRGGRASGSLVEFLTAVDGAMTEHSGVVTLATTNAPQLIDDAARRAARFDRIIEVPRPGPGGRERIWQRYLRDLDVEVDLDRLVRATEGGTGADVREIVRHALLETAGQPTTSAFVRAARARDLPSGGVRRGQYL